MTQVTRDYNIVNKAGFIEKMAELTRRYKVTYDIVWADSYTQEVEIDDMKFNVRYFPVTVTFSFEEFRIEGYQYLGSIKDGDMIGLITLHGNDLTKDMNLSEFVSSFKAIPCNACNRKHVRKIGHLFLEEESGDVQVFGSGCAKKYFGINFDRVLSFFQNLQLRYDEWAGEYDQRFIRNLINTNKAVQVIYWAIEQYGYISKTKADMDTIQSTADIASELHCDRDWRRKMDDKLDILTKDVDIESAFTVCHTKDVNNKSDFEHNVEVIQEKMAEGLLTYKDFGWVSWVVYNQFFKPAPVAKVEYTLPEGLFADDKIGGIPAKLTNVTWFDGRFGRTYINTFVQGNVRYKWFSTINVATKLNLDFEDVRENGVKVTIKSATIKGFEDDVQYGKSVMITRAKVVI